MSSLNRFQLVLIIGISILVGYVAGTFQVKLAWKNYTPQFQVINKEPPSDITSVDMAPFWAVWEKVSQNYYDKSKIDPKKMLDGAITGMVQAVGDPFTMYLPPTNNKSFQSQLAGAFEGIGAELGQNSDKQIIVIAPLEGSPAKKAGIQAGDIIAKVDGAYTDGWTITDADNKIR
jgi:carboxyl-terminal processing protease